MYFLRIFSTISSSQVPQKNDFSENSNKDTSRYPFSMHSCTRIFLRIYSSKPPEILSGTLPGFFSCDFFRIFSRNFIHLEISPRVSVDFFFRNNSWHSFRISLGNAFKDYYRRSCLYCFMCSIRPHF